MGSAGGAVNELLKHWGVRSTAANITDLPALGLDVNIGDMQVFVDFPRNGTPYITIHSTMSIFE